MHTLILTYTEICVYMGAHMHINMLALTETHKYSHRDTCTPTCIHTHSHMYTSTQTHMYTCWCSHICTHTCIHLSS